MLTTVKLAMRITTTAYDAEILRLISAAVADLGIVDVEASADTSDPILIQAIITYVRLHFGTPDDFDHLAASYAEQKAQLISNRNYGLRNYVGE